MFDAMYLLCKQLNFLDATRNRKVCYLQKYKDGVQNCLQSHHPSSWCSSQSFYKETYSEFELTVSYV